MYIFTSAHAENKVLFYSIPNGFPLENFKANLLRFSFYWPNFEFIACQWLFYCCRNYNLATLDFAIVFLFHIQPLTRRKVHASSSSSIFW